MTLPISIKGVLLDGDRALLARNGGDEWELPGGRLDDGETPQQTVAREFLEETGLHVTADRLLHAAVFQVTARERVFIVAYACELCGTSDPAPLRVSHEHMQLAWLALDRLDREPLPQVYRDAIAAAHGVDAAPRRPDRAT